MDPLVPHDTLRQCVRDAYAAMRAFGEALRPGADADDALFLLESIARAADQIDNAMALLTTGDPG